jgi:two-component system, NarL family, response regulator NreC
MATQKVKLIIVDDNNSFREVFENFLGFEYDFEIIGSFQNAEELFKANIVHEAEILLMDIQMPGIDGITATKKIKWIYSEIKVIAITMFTDEAYLKELISAGFNGCVFKDNIYNEIIIAIEKVLNNKLYFPNNIKLQ